MGGKVKVIAGSGSLDKDKVKDLVLLWMEAGADIFDTSCSVMEYVQIQAKNAGFNLNDFEFCVSVPIEGDIHGKKAKINPEKCKKCGDCEKICIEGAISPPAIDKLKCVGCGHCQKVCKFNAIEFYDDVNNDFSKVLKTNTKIDTVEVHISVENEDSILKEFKKILELIGNRPIKISVCFNRKYFSNKKTEEILKKLKEIADKKAFVVQTDGMSMNLADNSCSSTLETAAFGLFVKSLGYDVILSGGCNEHTAMLVKKIGLDCDIGYGSYIRKLTSNLSKENSLKKAKEFIIKTKELIKC